METLYDSQLRRVEAFWDETSDSPWYRSLRTEEKLGALREQPESAFHPAVLAMIRRYLPDLKDRRVLLPSSGDNHVAFAFAWMGARVTSADISRRQLENAGALAEKLGLDIEFLRDDTMRLSRVPDQTFDLVYTSNGTLSWIFDLDSMDRSFFRVLKPGGCAVLYDVHPFQRPFSGEAWSPPRIVKSYQDVRPDLHWRVADILNAAANAGLRIREVAELPALDASFWFPYDQLRTKRPEDLEGLNDWRKNPLAALPAWFALLAQRP